MSDCHYCEKDLPPHDLRPYGPGGSLVCHPCITASPEREEAAKRAFMALLEGAEAASPLSAVVIDTRTSDGPNPLVLPDQEAPDA